MCKFAAKIRKNYEKSSKRMDFLAKTTVDYLN